MGEEELYNCGCGDLQSPMPDVLSFEIDLIQDM
jgi:hypothetical protein